mgnify:FL=1
MSIMKGTRNLMLMSEIQEYYQITLDLEPNQDGVLLIEPVYLNEKEYKELVKINSIWSSTSKKPKVHMGSTPDGGARFVATFTSLSLFSQIMDDFSLLAYSLITDGMVNDKGIHEKPRTNLMNSLSQAKAYLNGVNRVPGINKYFPENMIINISDLRNSVRLSSIHNINKDNIKKGFNSDK